MNSMSDQNLLRSVTTADPKTIADVIALMETIAVEVTGDDGLKWFNFLYIAVTKQIQDHAPAAGWRDPAWLAALFEARHGTGIDRIQFALAGMNAHINHDLSLALIQTDREFNIAPALNSPEHDDFEHVNDLLEAVMPSVLQTLATGLVGEVVQDTGKIGQLLAFWSVRAARNLAWDFAGHLSTLDPISRQFALAAQDQITGALGRALLVAV
jgi:hypothetical protein